MEKLRSCHVNEGFLVTSSYQEAGKGQRGNVWHSNKRENLLFSFLVKPHFLKIQDQFSLHMFTSLALVEMLEKRGVKNVKIKWPNDIYVDNKKIAGILVENIIKGAEMTQSVIGIGLNVNQKAFPLLPNATSIYNVLNQPSDLNQVLLDVSKTLTKYYLKIKNEKADLKPEYMEKLLGLNQKRNFKTDTIFEGIVVGLDDQGSILIKQNEQTYSYGFKEVEFVL